MALHIARYVIYYRTSNSHIWIGLAQPPGFLSTVRYTYP